MFESSFASVQHEQPRMIAFTSRLLRNQLWRQIKVEVSGSHRVESVVTSARLPNVFATSTSSGVIGDATISGVVSSGLTDL